MGLGHRVYKHYDSRATVMQKTAKEVLDLLGVENNPPCRWRRNSKGSPSDPYSQSASSIPRNRTRRPRQLYNGALPQRRLRADRQPPVGNN
jgi:hypothetical protein